MQTERGENFREITGAKGWETWVAPRRGRPLLTQTGDQVGATMGPLPGSSSFLCSSVDWGEGRGREGGALVSKSEQGGIARDLPELAKPSSAHPFH